MLFMKIILVALLIGLVLICGCIGYEASDGSSQETTTIITTTTGPEPPTGIEGPGGGGGTGPLEGQ